MLIQSVVLYLHWFVVFMFGCSLTFLVCISNLWTSMVHNEINRSYDYVIVGGGSAGAVLALRLSEISSVSVLLIEAGIDAPDILKIPALGLLKQTSSLDWQYKTVPQTHSCFGLQDNSSKWPAGKLLGGSSQLNYMIYLKGSESDFLSWKSPDSDDWSINDINRYFAKAREYVPSDGKGLSDNKKGSLLVRETPFTTAFSDAILSAAAEVGYSVTDLNEGDGTGFMRPQVSINPDGSRWTSDQKIKSILHGRPNLRILTNAVAEKILLRHGYEAYGVEYKLGGLKRKVRAKREIILSAGSIASPKILMLSGIGPEDSLSEAGIDVKIDLPVGKNLRDHITTGLDLIVLDEALFTLNDLTNPKSAFDYFAYGTGPFTSAMVDAVGVVRSRLVDSRRREQSPDLEFMFMMAGASSDGGIFSKNCLGISKKVWDEYFSLLKDRATVSALPVLLHPKSTGEVRLEPTDPHGPPRIDPRYLSEPADVATMIEGIRILERLLDTNAMKRFGARLNALKLRSCEPWPFDSDHYWECYVRHLTLTSYHPVGTCSMGSVVDHRLRVRKTNKLRVIDASIMPSLPSANTNAAVVMIAEKGADLIKEDYHGRRSTCSALEVLLPGDGKC